MSEEDKAKIKSIALILAAGSSSRMGQSKQLLKIGNESLLQKTIRTAIDSGVDRIVVALGSYFEAHQREISNLSVSTIVNPDWKKGMGSSLKFGIRFVTANFPNCEVVIVMVCDQPLLTSNHLKKLIDTYRTKNNPIVSSFYSNSPGVPVLFNRSMFEKLLALEDQQGAKQIVKDNVNSVSFIDFPEGAIDLDTPDDWEKFNHSK